MRTPTLLHAAAITCAALFLAAGCTVAPEPSGTDTQPPPETSSSPVTPAPESGGVTFSPEQLQQILDALDDKGVDQSFEQDTTTAASSSQVDYGAPDDADTQAYLEAVVTDLDTTWTAWFEGYGLQEPWVGVDYIMPGDLVGSNCPVNGITAFDSAFDNAFYCPKDFSNDAVNRGMLYLPVTTFSQMWTGNIFSRQVENGKQVGDFAAATIAAHEFGHHVQDELTEQLGVPAPANPNLELIADCFAGNWAYSAFAANYLEDGDIDEAINALEVIGDDKGDHGTGAERENAFLIGYQGSEANPEPGLPVNCIANYWPEMVAAA